MSAASSQASAFYEQVARGGAVFTFTAEGDYLVFPVRGKEVVPFWSSRSRMLNVQKEHPKYAGYSISEESLADFLGSTMALFDKERICIGVNWSGAKLVGYDIEPEDLRRNIAYWVNTFGADG